MTRPHLTRRAVLRGAAGAVVALPLLEAMWPRRARAVPPVPRRFLVWSTPNGTVLDRWVCKVDRDETDFGLSDILAPLERHKGDLIGIQNLRQHGGHAHGLQASLTARPFVARGGNNYATGISVDQLVANRWEGRTPIGSLPSQGGLGRVQVWRGSISGGAQVYSASAAVASGTRRAAASTLAGTATTSAASCRRAAPQPTAPMTTRASGPRTLKPSAP